MINDTVEELTIKASFALLDAVEKFRVSHDPTLVVDKVLKPFLTTAYNKGVERGSGNNLIIAMGMMSENMQRQALGQSVAYIEEDFVALTLLSEV